MPTNSNSADNAIPRVAKSVRLTLLSGVLSSGALLAMGLAVVMTTHVARPNTESMLLSTVARDALHGDPLAILYVGLVILIFTPVARVVILAVGWWLAGERRFAAVALTVLALLTLSLFIGAG